MGFVIIIVTNCTPNEVLFSKTYTVRLQIKRALSNYENNSNIYVSKESQNWIGKKVYVRLIAANQFDSPLQKAATAQNGFGFSTTGQVISDPLNSGASSNIFDVPALYEAVGLLGTGTASQTIGLVDFIGVEAGRYDLVAFVDTETRLSVEADTSKNCSCTRATGCDKSEYDEYLTKVGLAECSVLNSVTSNPAPSNGDLFYILDNIEIGDNTVTKIKELSLRHDSEPLLLVGGKGNGDQDGWDEWRCIYHISNMLGFGLHNYKFPQNATTSSDKYCLPGTVNCGSATHTFTVNNGGGYNTTDTSIAVNTITNQIFIGDIIRNAAGEKFAVLSVTPPIGAAAVLTVTRAVLSTTAAAMIDTETLTIEEDNTNITKENCGILMDYGLDYNGL